MGGFAGFAGPHGAEGDDVVARMRRAEVADGRPQRAAPGLCVWGEGDVAIAHDGDAALALYGYAWSDGRRLDARGLLARWRDEGEGLLATLHGELTIAARIGDDVIVARDRHGTRPLYVAPLRGGTAFSTAIGPLLAAGASTAVHRDGVVRSLVLGYVPAPDTALRDVSQVGAGEAWTLAPRTQRRRWYTPRERIARRSIAREAADLDAAIGHAVTRALPPRGRVGAFLSGGIDSSLVLARVREAGGDVEAFTLHFGDDLPGELPYALAVAKHLGVRHHVLELDARAFVDGLAPALLHLEDSLSEPIAVPNFLLARHAARSCDVLFTGEGGDPSFGGPKNVGMLLARAYEGFAGAPSIPQAYLAAHHHLVDDLPAALTPEWLAAFDGPGLERWVGERLRPLSRGRETSFLAALMRGNVALKGANNILVKVAKMVGAHDVALRSPLFDRDVVDLALAIPPWHKLHGTEEKTVLKMAARRHLPAAVVDRPKRGMAVPLRAWLAGALGELARDTLTRRAVRERGIFRWEYVERLLRLERMPTDLARSRSAEKLWLVLVTELHQRSLDRPTARRAA